MKEKVSMSEIYCSAVGRVGEFGRERFKRDREEKGFVWRVGTRGRLGTPFGIWLSSASGILE